MSRQFEIKMHTNDREVGEIITTAVNGDPARALKTAIELNLGSGTQVFLPLRNEPSVVRIGPDGSKGLYRCWSAGVQGHGQRAWIYEWIGTGD